MNYFTTLSLYSFLLGCGYIAALLRRGRKLHNGVILRQQLPALKPLYAQVVLAILIKPRQLPAAKPSAAEHELPELKLESQNVKINTGKLKAYQDMCHLPETADVPVIYPSIETFSMNLACMCMPAFPLSVLGGVLARYKATLYQPVQATEALSYRYYFDTTQLPA